MGMNGTYREYVGNLHTHSVYSDGTLTHANIAAAAARARLNFVIVTDHNVWVKGPENYYGSVLLLIGEELHNIRRQPQASHLLAYGADQELAPYTFTSAQTLLNTLRARGGFGYLAHPIEKGSRLLPGLEAIPWADWPLEGMVGLEIWNYMSEFKGLLWGWPAALWYAFFPHLGIRGPYRATLKLWDELLSKGMRLSAIGGADAHGTTYRWGGLKRVVFPYDYLFRCVNTHILTREPLIGEFATDKALVYEALRSGRTWVGYDLPHPTRGFRFVIRSGANEATVGETLRRQGALQVQVTLPATGEIVLLHNGKPIHRASKASELDYTTVQPGIYRVEVYRRAWGRRVGWIFSSPIYVE